MLLLPPNPPTEPELRVLPGSFPWCTLPSRYTSAVRPRRSRDCLCLCRVPPQRKTDIGRPSSVQLCASPRRGPESETVPVPAGSATLVSALAHSPTPARYELRRPSVAI